MTTDTDKIIKRLRRVGSPALGQAGVIEAKEAHEAADELDRLRAAEAKLSAQLLECLKQIATMQVDLSEERHAHNKTQFDLAQARKERALIVAIVRDVVNSFQDEDGYELAGQVRIRLKQIERGEHLKGGSDGDL